MRRKKLIVIFSILAVVVLVIFLGSVFFSVDSQRVTAYCYNAPDTDLENQVAASTDIKRQSIFFLSESKLSAQIDNAVNNPKRVIKIINIERHFPNRLSINFAKIFPFICVPLSEGFAICDNTGKVIEITPAEDTRLIKATLKGDVTSASPNAMLTTSVSGEIEVITAVMDALDRLNYRAYDKMNDITNLVESIDVSNLEQVIVKTRSGTVFKIIGTARLAEKMQMAVTLYSIEDPKYKTGWTITVWEDAQSRKIRGEPSAL